jgi:NADPH:quinone reductase-like Zn-dependent oxidoreductase
MSPMRAVLIKDGKGPVENLYIGEAPKPKPSAGQVLVKACLICVNPSSALVFDLAFPAQIRAFGLNRMDIMQREGNYPPPPGASSVLGVEFSGNIVEVGPSTSEYKVGDAVLGLVGGVSSRFSVALRSPFITWCFRVLMQSLSYAGRNSSSQSRAI